MEGHTRKMSAIDLQEYLNEVSHAAARFQFLEETLRMHLASCFRIVELSVMDKLSFGFTYKDLERKSLGSLIELFKKFNSNSELLKLLQGLAKERNYVAHQAYLMTQDEQRSSEVLVREKKKVADISEKAHKAVTSLSKESRRIECLIEELKIGTSSNQK
jgi:hypothetical protein